MTPSLGKSSLLHKLSYPNPNVWRKLGFPTLASPICHLGSLQGKLGFLTLTSCIHYLSLLGKLLAFSSSINKGLGTSIVDFILSNDMLPNFQHIA